MEKPLSGVTDKMASGKIDTSARAADKGWEFSQAGTGCETEDVDNAVREIFDELYLSLLKKEILHPSEERHRQSTGKSNAFDVIHKYHFFCRVCKRHFYVRSIPTDINSFFQTHLNTVYHRTFREAGFPRSEEMITWEEKWKTGRCNVCQMSGLVAIVRNAKKMPRTHDCLCSHVMSTKSEDFLPKVSLLKKFCQLSIFREKFINVVDDRSVCLLCCSFIPWSGTDAKVHLGSEQHFHTFYSLLQKEHNLALKDLLNGFNLEMIIRWIYPLTLKSPGTFDSDYERYRLECLFQSATFVTSEKRMSVDNYCPVQIDKLLLYQPSDFIADGFCLLCEKKLDHNHVDSVHQQQEVLFAVFFYKFNLYQKIHAKYHERLKPYAATLKNYKELKENSTFLSLEILEINNKVGKLDKSLRDIINRKLASVKMPPKVFPDKIFYCQFCDLEVLPELAKKHLADYKHLYYHMKWQKLKECAADERFYKTFQLKEKNKNKYVFCFLCGVFSTIGGFFSHLKGNLHTERLCWYCDLENELPIALQVKPNFSVFCHLCDSFIFRAFNGNPLVMNVVTTEVVQKHWPCPAVTNEKRDAEKLLRKSEDSCRICRSSQLAHDKNCSTNSLSFQTVRNAISGIMDAFEGRMLERVTGRIKAELRDEKAGSRSRKKSIVSHIWEQCKWICVV